MFWTCRATVCSLTMSVGSDVAVRLAGGDEAQDLELAWRQAVRVLGPAGQRLDTGEVG